MPVRVWATFPAANMAGLFRQQHTLLLRGRRGTFVYMLYAM